MYDKKMEEAARAVIAEHPGKRVLPFTYNNTSYFIKRCISNGRNRFAKQNAHMAYLTEVYKIRLVNSRTPPGTGHCAHRTGLFRHESQRAAPAAYRKGIP